MGDKKVAQQPQNIYLRRDCKLFKVDMKAAGTSENPVENTHLYECPENGVGECEFSSDVDDIYAVISDGDNKFTIRDTVGDRDIATVELSNGAVGFTIDRNLNDYKFTPFLSKDLEYFTKHMNRCDKTSTMPSIRLPGPPEIKKSVFPSALVVTKESDQEVSVPMFTIPGKSPEVSNVITSWLKNQASASQMIKPGKVVAIFYPEGNKKIEKKAQNLVEEYLKKGIYAVLRTIKKSIYRVDRLGKPDRKLTALRGQTLTVAYLPDHLFKKSALEPLKGDEIARLNQNNDFSRNVDNNLKGVSLEIFGQIYVEYLSLAGLAYTGRAKL